MRALRSILSLTLAAALVAGGLPVSVFEDADRDFDVDLQDAVQLVTKVAETAQGPADFRQAFQQAVSALYVVAGLKTVIQASKDNASDAGTFYSISPYLLSSAPSVFHTNFSTTILEDAVDYDSFVGPPSSPPPEIC